MKIWILFNEQLRKYKEKQAKKLEFRIYILQRQFQILVRFLRIVELIQIIEVLGQLKETQDKMQMGNNALKEWMKLLKKFYILLQVKEFLKPIVKIGDKVFNLLLEKYLKR